MQYEDVSNSGCDGAKSWHGCQGPKTGGNSEQASPYSLGILYEIEPHSEVSTVSLSRGHEASTWDNFMAKWQTHDNNQSI